MSEFDINVLLKKAVEIGASDVHFIVGEVPSFRIDGKIIKTKLPVMTEDDMLKTIPFSILEKFAIFSGNFNSWNVGISYGIRRIVIEW